jgi:hypothetical protein
MHQWTTNRRHSPQVAQRNRPWQAWVLFVAPLLRHWFAVAVLTLDAAMLFVIGATW